MTQPAERSTIVASNPATDEYLGEIDLPSEDTLLGTIVDLRTVAPHWMARSQAERIAALKQLQFELVAAADELSLVVNKQCGKSRQDALLEVMAAADNIAQLSETARFPTSAYRMPVVIVDTDPTYPLLTALGESLIALWNGKPVLILCDTSVAMVGKVLSKLFVRAEQLAPYVQVLVVDQATRDLLREKNDAVFLEVSEPKMATALFSTSSAVKEHVDTLLRHSYWHAGQGGMRLKLLFVPASEVAVTTTVLRAAFESLTFGYSDEKKDLHHFGPLLTDALGDTLSDWLNGLEAEQAKIVTGGVRDRRFFQPTLIEASASWLAEQQALPVGPCLIVCASDAVEFTLLARLKADVLLATSQVDFAILSGAKQLATAPEAIAGLQMKHADAASERPLLNRDTLYFALTRLSKLPNIGINVVQQAVEPGNYRMVHAILKGFYGATPGQRLESAEIVYNSYKVQQALAEASGRIQGVVNVGKSLFSKVKRPESE